MKSTSHDPHHEIWLDELYSIYDYLQQLLLYSLMSTNVRKTLGESLSLTCVTVSEANDDHLRNVLRFR